MITENSDAPQGFESDYEYRKSLLEIDASEQHSVDKTINVLSGGALGISMAFLENFGGGEPLVSKWMVCAWIALSASLLSNLLSHFCAAEDVRRVIKQIDSAHEAGRAYTYSQTRLGYATIVLNALALIGFVFGLALLFGHIFATIPIDFR